MVGESAPATADVQQSLARLQLQLAADQFEFMPLRIGQIIGLRPIGAGVAHGGIEHGLEDIVADVVMPFAHLERPTGRLRIEQSVAQDRSDQAPAQPAADFFVEIAAQQAVEKLVQTLHFPQAVHVRFAQPQGTVQENALVERVVENLHVPRRIAIDANSSFRQ